MAVDGKIRPYFGGSSELTITIPLSWISYHPLANIWSIPLCKLIYQLPYSITLLSCIVTDMYKTSKASICGPSEWTSTEYPIIPQALQPRSRIRSEIYLALSVAIDTV